MKADELTGFAFLFFLVDILLLAVFGMWMFWAFVAFVLFYLFLYYFKQKSEETAYFVEHSFQFFAPTSTIVVLGLIIYIAELFK